MSQTTAKSHEWKPVMTNQIRLRHLRQICVRSVCPNHSLTLQSDIVYYYTLHITLMSAPFYTSEPLPGENVDWSDVDQQKFPDNIVTSCPGVVIRLWLKENDLPSPPKLVTVWGVYFSGLTFLGTQLPKEGFGFLNNTFIFGMSWGYFVSSNSLKAPIHTSLPKCETIETVSYNLHTMCRIHRMQRAIYKQRAESDWLRQEIQAVQTQPARCRNRTFRSTLQNVSTTPDEFQLLQDLRSKRLAASARVGMLQNERTKQQKILEQLKESAKNIRVDNHTKSLHIKEKQFHLQIEKERLATLMKSSANAEEWFVRLKYQLSYRRRQLFVELAEIFPIIQEKNGLFSINGIVLPNSENFAGYDDSTLSVALGYVAHLIHILSHFLQIPNRYPIVVYSSRSRIIDQISKQDLNVDMEFPLYAKGKNRLYFEYAVYLLNKNIAQLRLACGLNTQDLAATLPNLSSLMQRLLMFPSEYPEKSRMQRTWSRSQETLLSIPTSVNMNHCKWPRHRSSSSLGGSEISLTSMLDNPFPSNASLEQSQITDSPQVGSYFRQPPIHTSLPISSSSFSLDLAVDLHHLHRASQFCSLSHHGSAPNLFNPEHISEGPLHTFEAQADKTATELDCPSTSMNGDPFNNEEKRDSKENSLDVDIVVDDILCSVSARTEALASASSSFKLKGRGRHLFSHSNA